MFPSTRSLHIMNCIDLEWGELKVHATQYRCVLRVQDPVFHMIASTAQAHPDERPGSHWSWNPTFMIRSQVRPWSFVRMRLTFSSKNMPKIHRASRNLVFPGSIGKPFVLLWFSAFCVASGLMPCWNFNGFKIPGIGSNYMILESSRYPRTGGVSFQTVLGDVKSELFHFDQKKFDSWLVPRGSELDKYKVQTHKTNTQNTQNICNGIIGTNSSVTVIIMVIVINIIVVVVLLIITTSSSQTRLFFQLPSSGNQFLFRRTRSAEPQLGWSADLRTVLESIRMWIKNHHSNGITVASPRLWSIRHVLSFILELALQHGG